MDEIVTRRQQLVNYFLNSSHPQGSLKIGAEFEKLGVFAHSGKAIPYRGKRGVVAILSGLNQRFRWEPVKEDDNIIGLSRGTAQITLEPGGQIELSGSTLDNIHQIKRELENHMIEIKSKQRYRIMAPYMAEHGKLSQHMMKKTASIQVNVDYSDEEDFAEKMRTALVLVPVTTAIFANSPISGGKLNSFLSKRAYIWNYTDPARCGLIRHRFFSNPRFSSYVDYALEVPMLFIVRDNRWIEVKDTTFSKYLRDGYQGYRATWDDWELHLSSIFTEVRVKSYIELRNADCQRRELILAVPALWKGILYSKEARRAGWSLMKNLSWDKFCQLYFTVPREGLKAKVRGVRLLDLAKELLKIACFGLKEQGQFNQKGEDESIYLDPLMELIIEDEICPAEIIIKNWKGSWHGCIDKLIEYSSY